MLYIIGLGVGDELDMTLKGIEFCRKSEQVFMELYTAKWQGSVSRLEEIIGKKIRKLVRSDMEEDSMKIVKKAKKENIAILVAGDPLSATTHMNMVMEARKEKVGVKVVHSSSILTAVAETGLSLYNFGKTVTVVRPQKGYAPDSFYDSAVENKDMGLHTLLLLDIDMDTKDGLDILLKIEEKKKKNLISLKKDVLIANRLGTESGSIIHGSVSLLLKKNLEPPAVIIIPGNMQFFEEEFLQAHSEQKKRRK